MLLRARLSVFASSALLFGSAIVGGLLGGCDAAKDPGTGGYTSSGSTTTSGGTTSSTGTGPVTLEAGLYGLADTGAGVSFVKVDAATGSVTEVSKIPSLTAADIDHADASVDPVARRYGALVSPQHAKPTLALVDGGVYSSVTAAASVFGLAAKSGTGSFFVLSPLGAAPGFGLLDGATGDFTKIGAMPTANFFDAAASNGADRYYFIGASDGAAAGQWLFTWDTTNGQRTQVDLPQDRKYVDAQVDTSLDRLFVATFDAGATPKVHIVDMDKTTGAMTPVLTLPITPKSTAPEDDLALDDTTYDAKGHRYFLVAKGDPTPGAAPDQLFVVDTTSGTVTSSPMLSGAGGSLHGLVYLP